MSGIPEGGKTDLTQITTDFARSSPTSSFSSFLSWVTGVFLVIVGANINWDYIGYAVPASFTIIMIPLTYMWVPCPYPGQDHSRAA